ncbi:TPA: hypothetical protein ACNTEZ_004668, partial [Escherichia coli]
CRFTIGIHQEITRYHLTPPPLHTSLRQLFGVFRTFLLLILKPLTGQYAIHGPLARQHRTNSFN